jgi:hypothetical protein
MVNVIARRDEIKKDKKYSFISPFGSKTATDTLK